MRKFLLSILLLLVFATPALPAVYYFDLASGNDSTGDGTYGTPWKTIDKCTTSRSAGDECRGAATPISTLSGTLTFTNGSTTVATSADLTGEITAGDFIRNTSDGSSREAWWSVASRDASSITLNFQWWGLSGSGTPVTGYKVTPVTASEQYDIYSGGANGNPLYISGGWDLATQTQVGYTAIVGGATTQVIFTNAKDYLDISRFILRGIGSYAISLYNGGGHYIHDLFTEGGTANTVYIWASIYNSIFEDITANGGSGNGFSISSAGGHFKNIYSFSSGTGTNDFGFTLATWFEYAQNLRVYNSYASSFYFSNVTGLILDDCVTDTVRSGANIYFASSFNNKLNNLTALGASSYTIYNYNPSANNLILDSNLTAGGSGLWSIYTSYPIYGTVPAFVIQETGSDSVMCWSNGTITHDSTGDCRSGKCLKYTPASVYRALMYVVGSVKITNTDDDLTLKAYIKDDASFDGTVKFFAFRNGKYLGDSAKTPTTSYVQESIVVDSSDLVANDYVDLYVYVYGTAGNLWVDDFSAAQ